MTGVASPDFHEAAANVEIVRIPVLGVVVVLAATAFAGCQAEPAPTPTPSPTKTTATPTPKTLSVPAYQALLTDAERAVRRGLEEVLAARTLREVDAARLRLADVMEAKATKLERILPPPQALDLHQDALSTLREYLMLREYDEATQFGEPNDCGVRPSLAEQLSQAKKQVYWRVRSLDLEENTAKFAKAGLSWGKHLMPPEPPDPPIRNRRAPNGQIIERNGDRGPGRLRINNGSDQDAVIAVAGGDPKRPQASIYVRSGSSATLTGLRGTYSVYFKSGTDWDAKRRSFTSGCTYESFLQFFTPESDWKIDLKKSEDGNALTNEVPAF